MTEVAARRFNVTLANRQRSRTINLRRLRLIADGLLGELPGLRTAHLDVSFVAESDMAQLNETFLRHSGPTDVITFDYSQPGIRNSKRETDLHGEILICVDEAITQARRFRTTWQAELVRYLIHGVLHLLGHDDHRLKARRKMKNAENRLLRSLAAAFDLRQLGRSSPRRTRANRKSKTANSRWLSLEPGSAGT